MNQTLKAAGLQGLKLGPIARAAAVRQQTALGWQSRNHLTLGPQNDRVGANRRYDLRDAATLLMMRLLTERFRISADAAAFLTNYARDKFTILAIVIYARIDSPGVPVPRERWLMVLDRVDASAAPQFVNVAHDYSQERRERLVELTIDLNAILLEACKNLVEEVGYGSFSLPESLC